MALARPLPHWGVDLTSQSSMSWWNSWATSWNKHFYFFLIYQLSPKETFFSPYIGQLLQSALIMKVHPSSLGATPERKMFAFGHCSHLFTQAAVVEWNQQAPTQGQKICVRDVPFVLGLISSYHLKCKQKSEALTPVFKIDFEVLPCNWCLKFDLFDSCYRTWVPLILFKPIKDSS